MAGRIKQIALPNLGATPALQFFAGQVRDAIAALTGVELLQGNLIENVVANGTYFVVNHQLGRPYKGYVIAKANGDLRVWDTAANIHPELQLLLSYTGTSTIASFWVF